MTYTGKYDILQTIMDGSRRLAPSGVFGATVKIKCAVAMILIDNHDDEAIDLLQNCVEVALEDGGSIVREAVASIFEACGQAVTEVTPERAKKYDEMVYAGWETLES